MKPLKLSEFFKIIKPEYVYLKLTPTTSIRNYNSSKIAKAVTTMHKVIRQQIRRQGHALLFETIPKVSYYIYMEKTKVEFYFIVPKMYVGLMREKIADTWNTATVAEVDSIPQFNMDSAITYQLKYHFEDGISLAVDKRDNDLLKSTLNVIEVMEQGDKVGVFYNFIPITQFGWRAEHENTIEKLRTRKPVERQKLSTKYLGKAILLAIIGITNVVLTTMFDMFGDTENEAESKKIEVSISDVNYQGWSKATKNKKEQAVLNTQILVLSDSDNRRQADNNATSVCQSFESIREDNFLVYQRCKINKTFNMTNTRIRGIDTIKTSVDECNNFISLPGRELLEQYKCIEKVDTIETQVPDELKQGVMSVGVNTHKGNQTKAFLTEDKEYRNLALCVIGSNRSGKSTLFGNLCKDGLENGECNIIFDFCGNAELSTEISALFSKDKVLNIDCSDFEKMQGLGYNEVREGKNVFERYRNAKMKTAQLVSLINSIIGNDAELKNRMERYLEGASNVVFLQSGSIRDVFLVLQDHKLRLKYLSGVPEEQRENLSENISALEELNEYGKGTKDNPPEVIGTRISYVQGILNRVNKLKANAYMELMLKKDCSDNIDLVDEMQKNQLICLKMPEVMFTTETEKDIYTTYWLTKVWLALQVRKSLYPTKKEFDKNARKVNLFIDEIYQVPQMQEFLSSKLSQMPKFAVKTIISCHHLKQIPIIRGELKSANCSYMLIAGSDKENYKELKGELYPYQEEDLLNLKRYHSLNLLKTNDGFARFITKLPPPIKKRAI